MWFWSGRLARAIWRGPFYIGKLSRPVPVGEALLKLLEISWRALIVVAMLGLALACWIHLEAELFPPLSEQFQPHASARYDDGKAPVIRLPASRRAADDLKEHRCSEQWPIVVEFYNPTPVSVEGIHFEIIAKEPGHSTNLAGEGSYLSTDLILPPRNTLRQCFRVPVADGYDPASLVYSVEISWVDESD